MPLVALPAAQAIGRRSLAWAAVAPLVLQLIITAYVWGHPRALWPGEGGDNKALTAIPLVGPRLNNLLPVLNTGSLR
jgi:hypothetical protein